MVWRSVCAVICLLASDGQDAAARGGVQEIELSSQPVRGQDDGDVLACVRRSALGRGAGGIGLQHTGKRIIQHEGKAAKKRRPICLNRQRQTEAPIADVGWRVRKVRRRTRERHGATRLTRCQLLRSLT